MLKKIVLGALLFSCHTSLYAEDVNCLGYVTKVFISPTTGWISATFEEGRRGTLMKQVRVCNINTAENNTTTGACNTLLGTLQQAYMMGTQLQFSTHPSFLSEHNESTFTCRTNRTSKTIYISNIAPY